VRRGLFALAPVLLVASCSLLESVDDYAGGPADAALEAGEDADVRPDAPADGSIETDGADASLDATEVADAPDVADAAEVIDAADASADADAASDSASDAPAEATSPYRHSIAIDGTNDFSPTDEKLATTTIGFDAYVAWDASALYVGYVGADIGATASPTKWVLVYLDADPGAGTGATKTEAYGTQQQVLPTGFGADAYLAWKTDGSYTQFKVYAGGAWSVVASSGIAVQRNASSSYVEMKIPFAALGATPAKLGVVSLMLNETTTGPWTWAGLYAGSFVDGNSPVASPITIGHWLRADLASSLSPNATSNEQ
jgi:hypothetical protein